MSSAQLAGGASGTGSMTVQAPNTNSNQVATLPDATGTVMVSGNMPAFSVYGSAQTIATGTYTKVSYTNKEFDTANCFDNVTNYRFTPNVAGYYQLNFLLAFAAFATGAVYSRLYKNGSLFKDGPYMANSNTGPQVSASYFVYANGTTDYFEIYMWQGSGISQSCGSLNSFYCFSGSLVRSA
jgi:hypothetical protein